MFKLGKKDFALRAFGAALVLTGTLAIIFWRPQSGGPKFAKPTRTGRLVQTSCLNHATHVRVHLESEASLLQLASPLGERELIDMQLNFVRNAVLAKYPNVTHFSFLAGEKHLRVTRREETYTDLPTKFSFTAEMIKPSGARLNSLIEKGELQAGHPQRRLQYTLDAEATVCTDDELSESLALNIDLPKNPETAFWSIPQTSWEKLTFKAKQTVTNPCADHELADLAQPEFYWYFWNPEKKMANKKSCREVMGRRLQSAQLRLDPVTTSSSVEATPTLAGRKGTFILGWLNTQFDGSQELPALKTEARAILDGDTVLSTGTKNWKEPTSKMLLQTLQTLKSQSAFEDFDVDSSEASLTFKFYFPEGRELTVFWGPTDALGAVPPLHFELLAKSLSHDDILVYAGHAALGASLLPPADHAVPLIDDPSHRRQLLAFLSCYSTNYLSASDIRPWTTADQIFVITTASAMGQFSKAALTILDPVISGQSLQPQSLTPTNTWSDDQFVISELSRGPARLAAERVTQ